MKCRNVHRKLDIVVFRLSVRNTVLFLRARGSSRKPTHRDYGKRRSKNTIDEGHAEVALVGQTIVCRLKGIGPVDELMAERRRKGTTAERAVGRAE